MAYRRYTAPQPLLIGYDPLYDISSDHLARLVDQVVEETVVPRPRPDGPGQPPYDPRLCVKVLVYGYSVGLRSSRRLEQACRENLAFLYLTRGDTPSYRTLCTARTEQGQFLQDVWEGLFAVAAAVGLERVGRIVVDSTKMRADVSPEAVLKQEDFQAVRDELERILAEAAVCDRQETSEGAPGTHLGQPVASDQMRDILRRVRQQQRDRKAGGSADTNGGPPEGLGAAEGEGVAAGPRRERLLATTGTLPLEDLPAATEAPQVAGSEPAPEVGESGAAQASAASVPMTQRMLARVKLALEAIDAARAEGRKHLAVTDPDARMMGEGRFHRMQECHAWEVAVDQGLLVAVQTMQENTDNARLLPLVEAAARHEPGGIRAVDADSGYYSGDAIATLELQGIDTCIPEPSTAADLHRGQPIGTTRAKTRGKISFEYDADADVYRCPEGNTLAWDTQRQINGQFATLYRAQKSCADCPLAADCLTKPGAQHRVLMVGQHQELLAGLRARFADPAHVDRYHHRGEAVESVFGFVRGSLGYVRWMLRGARKVGCEGQLFGAAYQLRKIHVAWGKARRAGALG